jgi:NAD(P)-dependent dehydrogenase (short-subunit alcohol dehydrogenase family)
MLMLEGRAGRGLGLNMARGLAEAGAKGLAILDYRREEGEQSAKDLCAQTGVPVTFFHVDITDEKSVDQAVQAAAKRHGSIDILLNSAGVAE